MSRRGWFDAARDYFKLRALKSQLLEALKKTPRPGGVDLPVSEPLFAIAATELIREYPELTVTKQKKAFLLCRRADLAATLSPELLAGMEAHGHVVARGEKLYDDF